LRRGKQGPGSAYTPRRACSLGPGAWYLGPAAAKAAAWVPRSREPRRLVRAPCAARRASWASSGVDGRAIASIRRAWRVPLVEPARGLPRPFQQSRSLVHLLTRGVQPLLSSLHEVRQVPAPLLCRIHQSAGSAPGRARSLVVAWGKARSTARSEAGDRDEPTSRCVAGIRDGSPRSRPPDGPLSPCKRTSRRAALPGAVIVTSQCCER
jgi:hypothetical protein